MSKRGGRGGRSGHARGDGRGRQGREDGRDGQCGGNRGRGGQGVHARGNGRGGQGGEDGRDGQSRGDGGRRGQDVQEPCEINNEDPSQTMEEQVDTTQATQEEIGSGSISKRGITCDKGARKAMKASKTRLTVEFDFQLRQAICVNASAFVYECGYILRKNCSMQYKEWRHVPQEDRIPLRHKLLTLFDIDVEDKNVCEVIDNCMARTWRSYRSDLRDYFKGIGGPKDPTKAKTLRPSTLASQEDWGYLCDLWSTPKYLVEARKKRKWESRNGSKSIARYHKELGLDLNSSCGHIETWRSTHWNEEKGWTSLEASTKYEEMKKLRNENPVETMSDKYILEKVLGRSSNRLFGWGRSPVISNSTNSNGSSNRPTYNQLIDRIQELEGNQETMKQLLIEKNIMPPTSGTPSEHDSGRSPHGNTCFAQSNDDFSENNDGYDNNIE